VTAGKFDQALKEVAKQCKDVPRLEVCFDNEGEIDCYWGNMRWCGKPADFPAVLASIKHLDAMGIREE
jgi:hypothetical protein